MLATMSECGRRLVDDDLNVFESQIGFTLPSAYRLFLLKYNGGRPIPSGFPIRGFVNNPYGMIHYFFGIDQDFECYDLPWNWGVMNGRLPDGFLPIAGDHSGDLLCLSLYGDNYGSIVFWDFYDEHFPPTRRNVYDVADSFSEFLESLFEPTAKLT
jgi:hypothetical protein